MSDSPETLILNVDEAADGVRIDKFLSDTLTEYSRSFIQKIIKDELVLANDKHVKSNYKVAAGDVLNITVPECKTPEIEPENIPLDIIYEDDDILLINKAAGELSQKASPKDVSMVEKVIGYALSTQKVTNEQLLVCRPSVCNRLDRNTSGLIAAGFSIRGLQFLSEQFRTRDLHKYYMALVAGCVTRQQKLKGYLYKDEKTNKVEVHETLEEFPEHLKKDALAIETVYEPVAATKQATLLKVLLVTGRSHQIRAHLSSINHPIIGDSKYGDSSINEQFRKKAGTKRQLLHAYEMVFPVCEGHFSYLSQKSFQAPLPNDFLKAMEYAKIHDWKE